MLEISSPPESEMRIFHDWQISDALKKLIRCHRERHEQFKVEFDRFLCNFGGQCQLIRADGTIQVRINEQFLQRLFLRD